MTAAFGPPLTTLKAPLTATQVSSLASITRRQMIPSIETESTGALKTMELTEDLIREEQSGRTSWVEMALIAQSIPTRRKCFTALFSMVKSIAQAMPERRAFSSTEFRLIIPRASSVIFIVFLCVNIDSQIIKLPRSILPT